MHSKESWSGLPKLLKVGNNFECRVDAESIAMAYAESRSMLLKLDADKP